MKSCQEVSRLISEQHDRKLSTGERIKLRVHLAMCKLCARVAYQLAFVRKLARAAGDAGPDSCIERDNVVGDTLSPEARDRIRKAMTYRKA